MLGRLGETARYALVAVLLAAAVAAPAWVVHDQSVQTDRVLHEVRVNQAKTQALICIVIERLNPDLFQQLEDVCPPLP